MTKIMKPRIKAGEKPAVKYAIHTAEAWENQGDEVLENVAQMQQKLGAKYARTQIKAQGIKGKSAHAAGAIYANLLQELSVSYSIIADTSRRFVVKTEDCPFLQVWKNRGVDAQRLCESFGSSFVQGLCKGINPKLRYSVTRMMSKGNAYCEERIELVK